MVMYGVPIHSFALFGISERCIQRPEKVFECLKKTDLCLFTTHFYSMCRAKIESLEQPNAHSVPNAARACEYITMQRLRRDRETNDRNMWNWAYGRFGHENGWTQVINNSQLSWHNMCRAAEHVHFSEVHESFSNYYHCYLHGNLTFVCMHSVESFFIALNMQAKRKKHLRLTVDE